MNIRMAAPDITEAERDALQQVLAGTSLSLGPQLNKFEEEVARESKMPFGIGVNSGTSGLHLCVVAAGIGENDLVITTPFSFVASANCVLYEKGVPVFVDVDEATGNIDALQVEEASHALCKGGPERGRWLPPVLRNAGVSQTPSGDLKALLPVHAFGQPADMGPILETARHYDLAVIEDACEAIGAIYKGDAAGSFGDAAVFAFYPNKQITTGEGGMIVTSRPEWRDLFRSLRNQGRDVFDAWLNHTRLGYNYRLDELSAALGLVQIQRLDELLGKRAKVADWYDQRLADLELLQRPQISPTTTKMSWFVYVVRLLPPLMRDQVMAELSELNIPSRPYFTPIHLQPYYRKRFGYSQGDFPVTEYLGDVSLALPFSSIMTEQEVDYVCDALRRIVQK